jgi:hypothetical protein
MANRREALPPGRPVPGCPISARFWQMWEMREAHPLWFFVVIPTGAIRRIAQRRDLLLASSIHQSPQPGAPYQPGFGRSGNRRVPHICPVLADVGDARSASALVLCCHPDRSDPKDRAAEGPAVGLFPPPITTTWCPISARFWQMWEACERPPLPFYTLPATPYTLASPKTVKLFSPLPKCM